MFSQSAMYCQLGLPLPGSLGLEAGRPSSHALYCTEAPQSVYEVIESRWYGTRTRPSWKGFSFGHCDPDEPCQCPYYGTAGTREYARYEEILPYLVTAKFSSLGNWIGNGQLYFLKEEELDDCRRWRIIMLKRGNCSNMPLVAPNLYRRAGSKRIWPLMIQAVDLDEEGDQCQWRLEHLHILPLYAKCYVTGQCPLSRACLDPGLWQWWGNIRRHWCVQLAQ